MASGKKNYFRHHVGARNDASMLRLIESAGKEAYFHFFALVELCAEQALEEFPEDATFHFHPRHIASELHVKRWLLGSHLHALHVSGMCSVVVGEEQISVSMPNLAKFVGKYSPNSPNKRKEKERKEKESKTPIPPQGGAFGLVHQETPDLPINEGEALAPRVVISALNEICGTNFSVTESHARLIRARIADGFKLEDFWDVITHKKAQWSEDPKWCRFLRPQTLFTGNFDSYLQEARKVGQIAKRRDELDDQLITILNGGVA